MASILSRSQCVKVYASVINTMVLSRLSSCPKWRRLLVSGTRFNTLRPRQNGRHFADDIFKWILLNENESISIKISLKFVPNGQINNIPSLLQIMAWRRPGDKPLSESMMVSLLAHICVTRPQWVKDCAVCWYRNTNKKVTVWSTDLLTNTMCQVIWVNDLFTGTQTFSNWTQRSLALCYKYRRWK